MDCHLQMMIWIWCLLKNPSLMIGTWFSNSAIWSVDLNVHGLLLQQSSVSFSSMIRRAFSDGFLTHRSWQHVQGLLLTHMGDSKRGSHSESYFKKAFQAAPEGCGSRFEVIKHCLVGICSRNQDSIPSFILPDQNWCLHRDWIKNRNKTTRIWFSIWLEKTVANLGLYAQFMWWRGWRNRD